MTKPGIKSKEMRQKLDAQILRTEEILDTLNPWSEDYEKAAKNLRVLRETRNLMDTIDRNMLIKMGVMIVVLIFITWYNKHNILESRPAQYLRTFMGLFGIGI